MPLPRATNPGQFLGFQRRNAPAYL